MKLIAQIIPTILLCLVTGVVVYFLNERKQHKTAAVDVIRLFNEFEMKKDLELSAKSELEKLSKTADSVKNKLQMARAMKNERLADTLAYTFNYLNDLLEQNYQKSNEQINEQVWKRLNPLIDEYGKANNYHLIVGANGSGSVVYMDDYYDVTNHLITFVNRKYEGN